MKNFAKIYPDLSHSAGFTLVEMLVVISVISLVTAVLIPVLGRAKAAAYQVVCQSRLRQWGLGFEGYATQNRGFYPHTDGLDRSPPEPNKCLNIADKADWFGWVDMLPPLFGEKKWRDHAAGNTPGRDTIFQCPAAKTPPKRIEYFSYAMNSCLELDKNCWSPPDDPTGNNMPSFLNTASIKTPARVILLFDQLLDPSKGYNGRKTDLSAGKYCGSYTKAFTSRHARQQGKLGGLILYCDYHIEWTASVWKPEWPYDLEVPPRSDKDWFPY